jgi:hypothetical protein
MPSASSPSPRPSPSRRDVLAYGAGALAAGLLASRGVPVFADGAPAAPGFGRAKQLVFLYMIGGPSQFETLDPKPGTTTGGPTKTVATSVPGVELADSLPGLAKRMGHLCLIRSMTSREGNHDRARYLAHSGFPPNPTVMHPSIGSIVAAERGAADAEIPNFVSIGGPGHGNGYLDLAHAPFVVQDPRRPIANLELPGGLSDRRRDARISFLDRLNERFAENRGDGVAKGQRVMFDKSRRLMDSKKVDAFDLSKETAARREAFGASAFGQGCLMATRLLAQGVPVVEVMSNGWDTHEDNFDRTKALAADVDRGASALLDHLAAEGRLESTLVVWIGDFGRTPDVTASEGRGHFPRAWSTFLAGGGVRGGRVIGATDRLGREVAQRPVTIPDFFATLAHAFGIDGGKEFHVNGRPITYVDKAGKPVVEAFSA